MIFKPHYYVESVTSLTRERLTAIGVNALLLDVDSTLKPYHANKISDEIACWINAQKMAGVCLCLVSNGHFLRIKPFAESIGIPFIAPAMKPLPFGCRRAIADLKLEPKRTALVGDQIFTDVMAAKLAGIVSILVKPIQPEKEPFYARIKRPFERLVLRGMKTLDSVDK
ncbi:MAG: YqeG family HAD IIIA-type phosphatase [Planctomycetaceae bacterium]|jgi:HAD superfamily phosphatase (TIGR01668 family)|nr:YqeG family HAD IIIA-type phosphatase [Planctomycetaceae bacterium]